MERRDRSKSSESRTERAPQPQVSQVRTSQDLKEEIDVLPESYGRTTIVLLSVNPYLVHAYWEVAPKDLESAKGRRDPQAQPALRFYDVSGIFFDGTNAHGCFDVDIELAAGNWYVHLWSPGKSYVVDLGLRMSDGSFFAVARSNIAHTPPAQPSMKVDVQYLPVRAGSEVREMTADESPARESDVAIPPGKVTRENEGGMPAKHQPIAVIDMAWTVWKKLAELYRLLRTEKPGYTAKPGGGGSGAHPYARTPDARTPQQGRHSVSTTGASMQVSGMRCVDLTEMNESSFVSGMSSRWR